MATLLTPTQKIAQDIQFQQTRAREQQRVQQQQQAAIEQQDIEQKKIQAEQRPKTQLQILQERYGAQNVKDIGNGRFSVRTASGYHTEGAGVTSELPSNRVLRRDLGQGRTSVYDPTTGTYRTEGTLGVTSQAPVSRSTAGLTRAQIENVYGGREKVQERTVIGVEAAKQAERREQISRQIQESPQKIAESTQQQRERMDTSRFFQSADIYNPVKASAKEFTTRQQEQYRKNLGGYLGYHPSQPGSRAYEKETSDAYKRISQAGAYATMGAVLSSSELFAKSAELEAKMVGKRLGFKPDIEATKRELVLGVSERLDAYAKKQISLARTAWESPISAGIPVGAGFKVGSYVARASLLKGVATVGKVSSKATGVLRFGERVVEPGLTAAGIGYVGYDVAKSKDVYAGIGKISSYAAMTPGAMFGYGKAGTAISIIQTRGLKTVPSESIIKPEVLSGKERFPTTRAGSFEKFKTEFKTPTEGYSGYHATSEAFPKEGVTVRGLPEAELRPKDVPGLYVSPYKQGPSPAFLRIQGEGQYGLKTILSKQFFVSSPLKPEINLIRGITDIKRIKGGINVQKSRYFLSGTKPTKGTAYIEPKMELGGFKGEAQAVLPAGTVLGVRTGQFRVKVKGQYVPISERQIVKTIPVTPEPITPNRPSYFRTRQYYESEYPLRAVPIISSRIKQNSKIVPSSQMASVVRKISSVVSKPSSVISKTSSVISRVSKPSSTVSRVSKATSSQIASLSKAASSMISSVSSTASSMASSVSRASSTIPSVSRPSTGYTISPQYKPPETTPLQIPLSFISRKKRKGKRAFRPYIEFAGIATGKQIISGTQSKGLLPNKSIYKQLNKLRKKM